MTELSVPNGEFERRDEELDEISEQFGRLSTELGFEETPEIAAARSAFLRGVPAGRYDPDNLEHQKLLGAFHTAAEAIFGADGPNALAQIGYQIAVADLWFQADDPDRFYDRLDLQGETGIVQMLRRTPGGEEYEDKLYAVLDALESLNGG